MDVTDHAGHQKAVDSGLIPRRAKLQTLDLLKALLLDD